MSKKESKKARKKRLQAEAKSPGIKTTTNPQEIKKEKPKMDLVKLWPLALILLVSFICFFPSLENEFVNWDDDKNFYENPHITELNDDNFWENTKKIFTSPVIGNYNPLPIFTFAIEKKIFGLDNPGQWHLDNILFHLLCIIFVYLIGWQLGLGKFGTIVFTLFFAIHPLRVESVTWITERKDVLFGAFYLASLYYYIKSKKQGSSFKYSAIIWICFLLALFSKIQAVILPISFILVDYYLSGKLELKSMLRKVPFFIGSLIFGLIGIYFLKDQGSLESIDNYTGITRLFIGSFSLIIYFIKSIIPYELSPLYPYPTSVPWYFYVSIISFISVAAFLWFSYKKQWRVGFFGIAFFMSNIFFLLQILGAGQGFIADRFSYIAFLGLYFIYAYYLNNLLVSNPKWSYGIYAGVTALFLAYGIMTYNQTKIWKNSETLWTHVLKYYSDITLPYGNRANFRRDLSQELLANAEQERKQGNTSDFQKLKTKSDKYVQLALSDYSQTIRLKPDKAGPYNSRARLYFNFNSRDSLLKALTNYDKAIELKPDEDEYWINRGATYAKLGDFDKALQNLNRGIELNPDFQNGYLNRSVIYNQRGMYAESLQDVESYLRLKPYNGDMWYECARLRNVIGRHQNGIEAVNNAIKYGGQKGIYYFQMAKSYYGLKDYAKAKNMITQSKNLGYQGDQETIRIIMNAN